MTTKCSRSITIATGALFVALLFGAPAHAQNQNQSETQCTTDQNAVTTCETTPSIEEQQRQREAEKRAQEEETARWGRELDRLQQEGIERQKPPETKSKN